MKRNGLLLVFLLGTTLVIEGCANKPERYLNSLESIVEDVESNGNNYSSEDWEYCNQEFEAITEYLAESSDKLTPEQNREIGRLCARYHKAVVKNKINGISERISAIGEQVIGYSEELLGDNVE